MINQVQLLGERWSGTNYLQALVLGNYPGVTITSAFGGKHWFIKDHFPRSAPNQSTDHECIRDLDEADDTLFLVIVRNPYDWLRSMALVPYHAPWHRDLPFSEFIRKPWICQESRRLNPLWPEHPEDQYLIESAANILQLRALKLRHWLKLRERVPHVEFINHDRLCDNVDLLWDTMARHGLHSSSGGINNEHRYCAAGAIHEQAFAPRHRPAIDAEDLAFIRGQLDWEAERAMGFRESDYRHDDAA